MRGKKSRRVHQEIVTVQIAPENPLSLATTSILGQPPSQHFSQAFYCGTAMPRVDCVALGLGAQRTASTLPRPNLRAPCHRAPLRSLATKVVRNAG